MRRKWRSNTTWASRATPCAVWCRCPCIERNAVAAARALDANIYATLSDGSHMVSYDRVVEVMKQTGHDLPSLYRETGEGRSGPRLHPANVSPHFARRASNRRRTAETHHYRAAPAGRMRAGGVRHAHKPASGDIPRRRLRTPGIGTC